MNNYDFFVKFGSLKICKHYYNINIILIFYTFFAQGSARGEYRTRLLQIVFNESYRYYQPSCTFVFTRTYNKTTNDRYDVRIWRKSAESYGQNETIMNKSCI